MKASVISYEEYYPYGDTSYRSARSGTEVSEKRYRYTGKEKDEETGLYYHGARYYAAWLGRWTAADPAGMVDGACLYAYVSANPIQNLDPSGKFKAFAQLDQSETTKAERIVFGGNEQSAPPSYGLVIKGPSKDGFLESFKDKPIDFVGDKILSGPAARLSGAMSIGWKMIRGKAVDVFTDKFIEDASNKIVTLTSPDPKKGTKEFSLLSYIDDKAKAFFPSGTLMHSADFYKQMEAFKQELINDDITNKAILDISHSVRGNHVNVGTVFKDQAEFSVEALKNADLLTMQRSGANTWQNRAKEIGKDETKDKGWGVLKDFAKKLPDFLGR